jgi:hypothetical protein
MFHDVRLSVVAAAAVAFGSALALESAHAQQDGWRELRLDGSSPESFQASVAALQNALPTSRRDDFETALAVIWYADAVSADIDGDGQSSSTTFASCARTARIFSRTYSAAISWRRSRSWTAAPTIPWWRAMSSSSTGSDTKVS